MSEEKKVENLAIAIIKNADGKVLIHRRNLVEDNGVTGEKLEWTFAGGRIHGGETAEEAAAARATEKTGYKVSPTKIISVRRYHPFGYELTYVACNLLDDNPTDEIDPEKASKVSEVLWVSPEELDKYFTTNLDDGVANYLGISI